MPPKGVNPNPLFNFIHPGNPIIKVQTKLMDISIDKDSHVIDFKSEKGGKYVIVG